jgi:hypothetical protein
MFSSSITKLVLYSINRMNSALNYIPQFLNRLDKNSTYAVRFQLQIFKGLYEDDVPTGAEVMSILEELKPDKSFIPDCSPTMTFFQACNRYILEGGSTFQIPTLIGKLHGGDTENNKVFCVRFKMTFFFFFIYLKQRRALDAEPIYSSPLIERSVDYSNSVEVEIW